MSAVSWIQKYGKWVAGVALVAVGFLFGVAIKRRPVVSGANPTKKKVEEQTTKDAEKAVAESQREKDEASHDYVGALRDMLAAEEARAKSLENDPEALNRYLKETGALVRGDGS